MRKCFNFFLASVIRLQCSRFPRALIDIHRHCHQWLGGQHGEEAKDEGEGGGEKGREEDQAPEEEVTERRSYSLRLRTTSVTASNGPADVEVMSASLLQLDTPAPVDDRGRRRDRGSNLTLGFADKRSRCEERVDGSTPHRSRAICRLRSSALADALGFFSELFPIADRLSRVHLLSQPPGVSRHCQTARADGRSSADLRLSVAAP